MLDAFTAKTGIQVNYQGTRALSEVLVSNVQGGTPPDVAVLASPGELANYARDKTLLPLDDVIERADRDAYGEQWLLPQQTHVYVVPLKANLKSLVWFNPRNTPSQWPPRTWAELSGYGATVAAAGGVPWCMGVGDGPGSGWSGSDMIETILLRRSGTEVYGDWAAGRVPWTAPEVRSAWQLWGTVATESARGGATSVLLTDFGDAARPMFTNPPGCYLEHQASFIMGFYRDFQGAPKPGADFDFFPFPAFGNPSEDQPFSVSADWAGMFNNTPQARELISYLATAEAQQIWPAIDGSSAFTVNRNVPASVNGDAVSRRIADILNSGSTLCFDAADLMPANLRNAYYRTVLEYLNDPSQLDALLVKLDKVRRAVPPAEWLGFSCGQ